LSLFTRYSITTLWPDDITDSHFVTVNRENTGGAHALEKTDDTTDITFHVLLYTAQMCVI